MVYYGGVSHEEAQKLDKERAKQYADFEKQTQHTDRLEQLKLSKRIVNIIYSLFTLIRNDWSDPRHECRTGWEAIENLNAIMGEPTNAEFEKAIKFCNEAEHMIEEWSKY